MFSAPESLPGGFGARTFSTEITTSMVQDLNEKIDCMYYALIIYCVARIVAETLSHITACTVKTEFGAPLPNIL
jgi:hypothetical protein